MGWVTSFHATEWKYQGGRRVVDRRKECDRLLTWDNRDKDGKLITSNRVLKSAMVGSTYYAAVEKKTADGSTDVWAAIFLTCGKGRDGTVWGYKDMEESSMPYYFDCPSGILSLLTPTDDKRANEWREKCRERLRKKAEERKNPPKLYAPTGVEITVKGHSWVITSQNYRATNNFSGVRFSKAKFHNSDTAIMIFLYHYGTPEQKHEFAMSGRVCPIEWKEVAA